MMDWRRLMTVRLGLEDEAYKEARDIIAGSLSGKYHPAFSEGPEDAAQVLSWIRQRKIDQHMDQETVHTEHRHKCSECGEVWKHDPIGPAFSIDEDEYRRSHLCPKCGHDERSLYYGKELKDV